MYLTYDEAKRMLQKFYKEKREVFGIDGFIEEGNYYDTELFDEEPQSVNDYLSALDRLKKEGCKFFDISFEMQE